MSIGRICRREVDLADADESVVVAAKRMKERMVGTLVVLDGQERPLGILTDRDIAIRVVGASRKPETTRVEDVMTAHPRFVTEGTPIEDALATMRTVGVRRLLVTDDDERFVGIVALDDVLSLLIEEFRTMEGILASSSPSGTLVAH